MDPAQEVVQDFITRHRAYLLGAGDSSNSAILPAYRNSTVFITGGAGFLGKHLLEKLFRSCEIKMAYLLLRSKKGRSAQERLANIAEDSIFNELQTIQPDFKSRLVAVEGDATELRLGISDDDWTTLIHETEFIFHGAATVNFEEHIRVATLTNVRGTREMVALARDCKKLRGVVHISTAYAQATREIIGKEVPEEFHPPPITPEIMINMAENLDGDVLQDIASKLSLKWPNTYTFTKTLAEELIRNAADDLPICVIRPAIVISAYREPMPGWVDASNAYGPSGLVLGGGLGIMHILHADTRVRIDLVPVDYTTNATIAAGWSATQKTHAKIYTVATNRHYEKWGKNQIYLMTEFRKYISPKAIWYGFIHSINNVYLFHLLALLCHDIPAYFLDTLCWMVGKPQIFKKIYSKVSKLVSALTYFTTNEWQFVDQNLLDLYNNMTEYDKIIFYCDISSVNWREQMLLWAIGVRKYIIKDGLTDTEYGIKKQFRLRILHYILSVMYFYVLWKILSLLLYVICSVVFGLGLF